MMEDRKWWKLTWIMLLTLSLMLTPMAIAQDDEDEDDDDGDDDDDDTPKTKKPKVKDKDTGWKTEQIGKGMTEKGALNDAWVKGMMKYLEEESGIADADIRNYTELIKTHLEENLDKYAVGDPYDVQKVLAKPYKNKKLTAKVRIKDEKLRKAIESLVEETRGKMASLGVIFLPDPEMQGKDEFKDREYMDNALQDILGQHFQVTDAKALQDKNTMDMGSGVTNPYANTQETVFNRFNDVKVLVYVWLKTETRPGPVLPNLVTGKPEKTEFCFATIGCRGVWKIAARQLWRFQLESKDLDISDTQTGTLGYEMARQNAIKGTAQAVANEIVKQIRDRMNVLEQDVYVLRFTNFKDKQKDIMLALDELGSGKTPVLKVRKGFDGTPNDFTVMIKWIQGGEQMQVAGQLEEAFKENKVRIQVAQSTTGYMVIKPKK